MRLEKIQIKNFRSFQDETINFDRYICLVGTNGAGKSTILTALNVFFRNTASAPTNVVALCAEDFHHGNTGSPVEITLTFKDLSDDAKRDLSHYYRQDRLVVTARADWNKESANAEVKQHGERKVMKALAPYFEAKNKGEKAAVLKEIYDKIREGIPKLQPASSGPAREEALRQYEEAHPEECELTQSPEEFFGFTRGANLLEKYIQWVYIPAVKDASSEQQESNKSAFKELLDRTVRTKVNFKGQIAALKKQTEDEYRNIVEAESDALGKLQDSLENRLKDWYTPNATLQLKWQCDGRLSVSEPTAQATLGEDNFVGEVARLGHGMQRSFLIAMLHELAMLNAEAGPTLLLGFEEPELYLHPPQAQHVSNLLETMANGNATNTQVVVSTHSPYFVSTRGFENVRVVRKHFVEKCSLVTATSYADIEALLAAALNEKPNKPSVTMAKIEQIMQPSQKELFFTRVAILVEGLEDIGFIATQLVLDDRWHEFRRLGCHFVVTGGKTNMSRPLAIASNLCIRTYAVFDSDLDEKRPNELAKHCRDNGCLLKLCNIVPPDPFPTESLFFESCAVLSPRIATVIQKEAGNLWESAVNEVRVRHGLSDGSSKKNRIFIAAILEELRQKGFSSASLRTICDKILVLAEKPQEEGLDSTVLAQV
jgi:putative ATP-dependent endonuclease of the OLD family